MDGIACFYGFMEPRFNFCMMLVGFDSCVSHELDIHKVGLFIEIMQNTNGTIKRFCGASKRTPDSVLRSRVFGKFSMSNFIIFPSCIP
jgi:hypothetical protein